MIRRREVIALIGAAVVAWPVGVRAQQPAVPVIGFLSVSQPTVFAHMIDAFRKGLSEMGYVEGRNLAFEHRAAGNEYARFRAMADDLVQRQVVIIFATGDTNAALAAKAATATIPILIYTAGEPVKQGLIASLNRPGGNITGYSWLGAALAAKRLEVLHQLAPRSGPVAMLVNPNNPNHEFEAKDVQEAARSLGSEVFLLPVNDEAQLYAAFETIKQRASALIVASNGFFSGRRGLITALAARHGVPAIYERRDFPDAGGLISYGHHRAKAYRQLGIYAGRILKGEKPVDLPVIQPSTFELVLNLNAAKALGLEIPPKLLALADEVIE